MMKTIALCAVMLLLLLAAGCTTGQPAGAPPAPGSPAPQGRFGAAGPFQNLHVSQPALLENGSYALSASIDHMAVDRSKPGKHTVDIYTRATNTGKKPVQLVWFSTITDSAGKSHGGIGVSHGGSGAQGPLLYPGDSALARDFVVIEPDAEYAALAKGGTLGVVFLGRTADGEPVAEFHAHWVLEPGTFG